MSDDEALDAVRSLENRNAELRHENQFLRLQLYAIRKFALSHEGDTALSSRVSKIVESSLAFARGAQR